MKSRLIPALVWVWVVLAACTAHGQTTFTSADGDWWGVVAKGEAGRGRFTITDATGSGFSISGFGYLHKTKAVFFQLPPAQLAIDFRGRITGELDLLDEDGGELGTIAITAGRFLKQYARFDLAGTYVPAVGESVSVSLKGSRMPEVSTVLTGQSNRGEISGRGLNSSHLTLSVEEDDRALDTTGNVFPFYTFSGGGNVFIDGEARDVSFGGGFVVSPDRTQLKGTNAVGNFISPELGEGVLRGNLMTANDVRTARFIIKTDQRSLGLAGILDIATSPIISVQPSSGVDYGTLNVDDSKGQEFIITNIGVDILDGDVTVDGDPEFSVVSGDEVYSLGPGEEARVTIEFAPTTAGSYSGTATFTGGGGAIRTLQGVGRAAAP